MASRLTAPRALAQSLGSRLGRALVLRTASTPLDLPRLSVAERAAFDRFSSPARREGWRLGRTALKAVLRDLHESDDTAALRFPHARLSLSHSGGWAASVGVAEGEADGLGVDLEIRRPPRPEAARRFLSPVERGWLESIDAADRPRALLRLWCLKEAVFKADLDNGGRTLAEFEIVDPGASTASAARGDLRFRAVAEDVGIGILAVAVRVDRDEIPR